MIRSLRTIRLTKYRILLLFAEMTLFEITSATFCQFLLHPGRGTKYCNYRVCMYVCLFICLFVCLLAYLKNTHPNLYKIFCTCYLWPWLGPLTMMQYAICFWFCGCHHVFT